MYRLITAICIIVMVLIVAAAACAQNPPPGITVNGSATVKSRPDVAYVSFGVTTQDKDAAKAAKDNAAITNRVIEAIVKSGVPKSDIETINYSVSPMYNYPQNSAPVLTGYTVSNIVRAKLRDIAKVGALIDTGIKAGANNVQGVTFTIDNDAELRSRALAQAIQNANIKARAIAEAADVKLGRVYSVTESGGYTPRPMMEYGAAKAAEAPTPILPGDIEVTANVTVMYTIL